MSDVEEETLKLLEWEEQARTIVAEAAMRAKTISQEAERTRAERLTRAKEEARERAIQTRARLIKDIQPLCQAKRDQAEEEAIRIQQEASQHIEVAVRSAMSWLLLEGGLHARDR